MSTETTPSISGSDLLAAGWKQGPALGIALGIGRKLLHAGATRDEVLAALKRASEHPDDPHAQGEWRKLGHALVAERRRPLTPAPPALGSPKPYPIWGASLIDPGAIAQMDMAVSLPVSTRGALMPDAHIGYGLPIGGVLETKDAVIPYAVGSDIACRMRLTVLDVPGETIDRDHDKLRRVLIEGTVFGAGKESPKKIDSPVLEEDWSATHLLRRLHPLAVKQLGTSGSGNHFVEWGIVRWGDRSLLGLMSHSGSRGVGFKIADYYSKTAEMLRAWDLPKEAIRLSWLDLESDPGREYLISMELAGRFASENHRIIHERVIGLAGLRLFASDVVENHHNFAWAEKAPDGTVSVTHRKGATPAGVGVMGVIPGSMATTGFVVSGKGNADSLNSASHGAGRSMGRRDAERRISLTERDKLLSEARVTVIGSGLDESPQAYKSIDDVIAAQKDLVEVVATFTPRIVRMDTGSRDI